MAFVWSRESSVAHLGPEIVEWKPLQQMAENRSQMSYRTLATPDKSYPTFPSRMAMSRGPRIGHNSPKRHPTNPEGNPDSLAKPYVSDVERRVYPWAPPLVRDLALGDVGRLNELPSLICLCEAADEATKAKTLLELKTLASEYRPRSM